MSIAIKIENLSKQYRLGLVSTRTLSHDLNRWWQTSILGREDPYLKIGETNIRESKGSSEYVWALKDINLEVEEGEVLGIIGKNGAGKSTLLKILSKVTSPTTGVVRARGRIASLLEVGTGFHPEMTGRENIFMNGSIMGMTKTEIRNKFDEIVDFAGVERYIDTPVKRYSSGMTVRLGFAVAAHLEPEILVVDEVLAVGDAEFQKKAIGKMQDFTSGKGRTVLFVSHNMAAVKSLCNNSILLDNGLIKLKERTQIIIDRYLNEREVVQSIYHEWILSSCGRLKMKNPYILSKKNKSDIISQGESMTVVFELMLFEKFNKIVFGLALNDIQGNRILTSHSIDDDNFKIINPLIGEIKIQCKLKTELLAPKEYLLYFGVRDEANNNIIKSKNPLHFSIVTPKRIDGRDGILINAGIWSII